MDAKYITPAVTAFDHEGHVDMEANKRIYQWLIEGGMDGILILGSIGEFFAIPMEGGRTESWSFHPITLTCLTVPS